MKTVKYKDFELELPNGPVAMTHSFVGDAIRGESSTKNMDWTVALGNLPWSQLKEHYPSEYVTACSIFSLLHMDYQVCNGGISQYFSNHYHEPYISKDPDALELYGLPSQKQAFADLVTFAGEIYPERKDENWKLSMASAAFSELSYEDAHYEDVIYGGERFESLFDNINEYIEELLEVDSQFVCKTMTRGLEEQIKTHPDLEEIEQILCQHLPVAAFDALWITVYRDTLGFPDDFDNLTVIQVPTPWLVAQIAETGMSPEEWLSEYTADWTDAIARKALAEGVILDYSEPEIKAALSKGVPSLTDRISDADRRRSAATSAPEKGNETILNR